MMQLRSTLNRIYFVRPARKAELSGKANRGLAGEDGQTMVEMALTCSILFAMIFGIVEISLALYTYNFVSEAAREATRYAVIRGSNSCVISPTFPDCNLNPVTTGNPAVTYTTTSPLQTYLRGRQFPYSSGLTVTAAWFSPSGAPSNTWTTACTISTCNAVGNAVQVTVTYAFPVGIPYVGAYTISVHSTSQMVISE